MNITVFVDKHNLVSQLQPCDGLCKPKRELYQSTCRLHITPQLSSSKNTLWKQRWRQNTSTRPSEAGIFMIDLGWSILSCAKSISLRTSLLQLNSVPKTDLQSLISQPSVRSALEKPQIMGSSLTKSWGLIGPFSHFTNTGSSVCSCVWYPFSISVYFNNHRGQWVLMYVFVSLPAPTQMSEQHCLEEKHRIHYENTKNPNIRLPWEYWRS